MAENLASPPGFILSTAGPLHLYRCLRIVSFWPAYLAAQVEFFSKKLLSRICPNLEVNIGHNRTIRLKFYLTFFSTFFNVTRPISILGMGFFKSTDALFGYGYRDCLFRFITYCSRFGLTEIAFKNSRGFSAD